MERDPFSKQDRAQAADAAGSRRTGESFRRENQYDFLTGLPVMTYFFELAEAGRDTILQDGGEPVLLFLDLNGMKYYNHKNGFAEGNKLLQAFARVLARTFGKECCCHITADHFAAFAAEEGLEDRLQKMFDECLQMNGGRTLPVRAGLYPNRMGIASGPAAIDRAKLACDSLRKVSASSFSYYTEEQRNQVRRQVHVRANLDRAVSERWIRVYTQPIVRAVNNQVCAEEALARWIDPVEGLLSPADFIPYLEDEGLIWKLDLCILDQVLEKLQGDRAAGLHLVPHSINLSRSDFDACDMPEEIRRRTDAAGIPRDRIAIEITESIIGSDFNYIKEQIERFRALGFPVWMDDFGSGYSSLDVLQSVRFDLIKFDMNFMRKLDETGSGRIILGSLVKMANAIGVDTLCEGVEKEEQVRFLEEIGCGRLQGFYFSRPKPLEEVRAFHLKKDGMKYEDPDEVPYYDAIGRVNLSDLTAIASEEGDGFEHFSNSIPMAIIEVRENTFRYVRSNQGYRDFTRRFFRLDLPDKPTPFRIPKEGTGSAFTSALKQCCAKKNRMFLDEQMPDGSLVHSFLRRIGVDEKDGTAAVAVAVLSVTPPDEGATYAAIARALASDYYNIYYIDLETEKFIEYSSQAGEEEMAMERHGDRFFERVREDSRRIYEEDREEFYRAFSREQILKELDEQGVFTMIYRVVDTGAPMYVSMKITRMPPGRRYIILGVSLIDVQMKEQERMKAVQKERDMLSRIMALSEGYLTLYSVDPESGEYVQYSTSDDYETFGFAHRGEDFYLRGREDGKKVVYPEDLPGYLEQFTKENVLRGVRENGDFRMHYRLVVHGNPVRVTLKAVLVQESDGQQRLIVAVRAWQDRGAAKS